NGADSGGRVLQVAGHDGDHPLQAAGHLLRIPPGGRRVTGPGGQGMVGGLEEVAERGLPNHGPAPASRSLIRAAQAAASRQAARSAPSAIAATVRARPTTSSSLSPATELAMALALS